jgi:4a-hydroxytetrahydrobiopterin dehydratase
LSPADRIIGNGVKSKNRPGPNLEGNMQPLSAQEANARLSSVPGWQIEAGELVRLFKFEDFRASMRFVHQVAELAEEAGHHPDIDIRYNRVRLALVSHDAGGLTSADFELAGRADKLV